MNVLYRLTAAALASLVILIAFGLPSCDSPTKTLEETEPDTLFEFRIPAVTLRGSDDRVRVPVTVSLARADLTVFDLLVVIDHPGITVSSIRPIDIQECRWTGFGSDHQTWDNAPLNCYRVRGSLDVPGTTPNPDTTCLLDLGSPYTLFNIYLKFDRQQIEAGEWIPIRFYWATCANNDINYVTRRAPGALKTGISRYVIDQPERGVFEQIEDPETGFPTVTGIQDECFTSDIFRHEPVVGFVNGGVQIPETAGVPFLVIIRSTATEYGGHGHVHVKINSQSETLLGFDLLLSYDDELLTLTEVVPGTFYDDCGWEYFTYETSPAGFLHVVGFIDINNASHQPDSHNGRDPLFIIDFLVTDDPSLEGARAPVRFVWTDCDDNMLSFVDPASDSASIGAFAVDVFESVYDYPRQPSSDPAAGFPTHYGFQSQCIPGDSDTRFADFVNGYVRIDGPPPGPCAGDINLNGWPYEIADVVLYHNYFVQGPSAFTIDREEQIRFSDVNNDGLTLGLADLVYLIRVIVGDAFPWADLSPVRATWLYYESFLSVDKQMGAALITVPGNVTPTLLADNMDMNYAFNGTHTRILIYSFEVNQTFSGQFIALPVAPDSVELATYQGARVMVEAEGEWSEPTVFPNPFHQFINIGFTTSSTVPVTIRVTSPAGLEVWAHVGTARSGSNVFGWRPAEDVPPGAYLVNLTLGDDQFTLPVAYLGP